MLQKESSFLDTMMDVNNKRIVIIGNGFDLHHNIACSYWHYKEWLKISHPDLLKKLERYIDVSGDWWNDFERNLAKFDIRKMIKECPRVYPPQAPRFPPSITYPANWFFDEIRSEITVSFTELVKSLSWVDTYQKVDLPDATLYISFNYTDTLERVYGIPEERILYIHGKAIRGDKLIFGHSKSHYEIEQDYKQKHGLREIESIFDMGLVISGEERQLAMYVSFLDKFPYTQLVSYSNVLMPAVKSSDEIVSYGLSFSEVDFLYMEWIAEHKNNLKWRVSWHKQDDKEREETFFRQMGIKDYSLFEF